MISQLRRITPKQIVWVGVLFTLLYALLSSGVYHPDEHFQILEYAHMKLFGTPVPQELPWEYQLMMRPGFQPWIAYALGVALQGVGLYSSGMLVFLLHLLSGVLSTVALLIFYRVIRGTFSGDAEVKGYFILSFFLWFMAYLHVRFSSEVVSGNLMLLLVAAVLHVIQHKPRRLFWWGVLFGVLAGGAFITRYQMGFALLGFGLWVLLFIRRWQVIVGMIPGVVLLLGVGVLTDYWLYDCWTCSPINYLRENILNARIDSFGVDPWYYYFLAIPLEGGIFYGLGVLAATVWFLIKHPKNLITWMIIPFLLAHQLVGHKEVRFLFPLLVFAPYFLVLLFRDLPMGLIRHRAARIMGWVLVVANFGIVFYNLAIPNTEIYFYRMLERWCEGKQEVVILHLKQDKTYYSYWEGTITPRLVASHFYMPSNMRRVSFDSLPELEQEALRLQNHGAEVLILSQDQNLAKSLVLPLQRMSWNPYPEWVTNHFNFNDWVGQSVRRRNIFQLSRSCVVDEF